jgi:hypothetical protein
MHDTSKQNTCYQPLTRGFYAFLKYRCGDFIIFKESYKDYYEFIYVPGGDLFRLTIEDFTKSVKSGMLEFVEQLPEDVYNESLELSTNKCCNVQTTK